MKQCNLNAKYIPHVLWYIISYIVFHEKNDEKLKVFSKWLASGNYYLNCVRNEKQEGISIGVERMPI